jgi:anaerobic carbon-monoxide dehydrogenase iron sulfur subunit
MKRVYCKIEKCLSCRSCELACAVVHSRSGKLADAVQEHPLPKSRIHVESIDEGGSPHSIRSIALQCRHCEDPLCAQACISGGISRDSETGVIINNPDQCVACWSCIMVCPFGVIVRYEDCRQAVKCDHCADRNIPACVEACPTQALVFCEPDKAGIDDLLAQVL